ncbi:GIY-YIG nuclease family protein [Deinococcus sp. HMF7604]|uniref:GIY-YIG nuclease family protein n=1 Tax=Deinococcus betulae TaxID=2873312 RepID=UPI001CC9C986|nr:GIY-YIG nuclease family protein [Deinococcus betulae]MBZ9751026.1 GIY-YIG nuclease family protein [Deinococcus betulae]
MTEASPRRYRGFTPRMGVYRITHLPSGRTLLGSSVHVEGLLNRIRFQLELGGHRHAQMQRDWAADGPAQFRFEVLDDLQPQHPGDEPLDDLKELLALWEEKLNLPAGQRY